MTQLPMGWTQTTLGAVATTQAGFGFPPHLQGRDAGDLPFAKVGDISRAIKSGGLELTGAANYINRGELAELKAKTLPAGTTVFAKIGEAIRLNRRAITTSELVVDNNVMGLIPDRRQIDPRFLLHFMRTVDLYPLAGATTVPSIRSSVIQSLPILLPTLPQQERIVEKLEALQARSRLAREALEAVPPLLEKLRQSILAAAFRGDLTKEWRAKHPDVEPATELLKRIRVERRKKWEEAELAKMTAKGKLPGDDGWKAKYKEPAPVDPSGLPELPKGWCWASVEELANKVVDGVHKKPQYLADGIPFLTVRNLTAGPGISFDETSYIGRSDHEEFIKRTDPERGDILISKDGTLGVTRLITTDAVFSIFVSLALVKPTLREMGDYLEMALWSPYFQERFKSTGSGLLHIHLIDLRSAALPIAPREEQEKVIETARSAMASLESLVELRTRGVRGIAALDSAVLAKAFRGHLLAHTDDAEAEGARLAHLGTSTREGSNSTPNSGPTNEPKREANHSRPKEF